MLDSDSIPPLHLAIRTALPGDLEQVRVLIREYAELIRESICAHDLEMELDHLLQIYGPPRGRLLLAESGSTATGCVGFREMNAERCEMRRFYVRPAYRRLGVGRRLALQLIADAEILGYRIMELETLMRLEAARALYRSLGFRETAASDAKENVIRMELVLPG